MDPNIESALGLHTASLCQHLAPSTVFLSLHLGLHAPQNQRLGVLAGSGMFGLRLTLLEV